MYTDVKNDFRWMRMPLSGLVVLLLVAVVPAQQTTKELNDQLLYLLDQRSALTVEAVKQLLDKGAQADAQSGEGTALMMAVRSGNVEVVKLLLSAGAQVDAKNRLGDSALIMSARRSIPEMNPPRGQPLPQPAAEMMDLLLARGADANFVGQWGHTALMEANTATKIKLLVARGAQLNARDEEGRTALMHAVERGDVEVVEALLQAGADASVSDENGATALLYALAEPESYKAPDLGSNRLAAARLLLHAKIGNVNAQNENGETLLMRAVIRGDAEIVKSLLDHGADANLSDVLGHTAAVFAYEKNQTAIQDLLRGKVAKRTPLLVLNAFLRAAIAKKDQAKVSELLALGADANHEYAISYDHRNIKSTVLILATQTGDINIVRMLLKAGANPNTKGLLHGSEHGLKYGTALDAASGNQDLLNLLRTSCQSC